MLKHLIKNTLIGALLLSSYPIYACENMDLGVQVVMPTQKNLYKIISDDPVLIQSAPVGSCHQGAKTLTTNDRVIVKAFLNGYYSINYQDETGTQHSGWIPTSTVRQLQLTSTGDNLLLNDQVILSRLDKAKAQSCYPTFKQLFMKSDFPFDYWLIPEEEIQLDITGIVHRYLTAKVHYVRAVSGQSGTMAMLQYDLDEGTLWQLEGEDKSPIPLVINKVQSLEFQSCLLGVETASDTLTAPSAESTKTTSTTANQSIKYVTYPGRTYFYELDSGEFIQSNIFIIEGDEVNTSTVFGLYTKVSYTAKNGRIYKGWVLSDNLSEFSPGQ
ncbi:hypothetical protein [Thorsellia anophelis]|uniref:SH3 domain-containing protein n=1 Tax=Thorsellia anophelis DSM 18579 TaxID=1123402 RepID=A0A1I0B579_9GAMM|nr:hypothetical protein [Thorsellia anophelis]SET01925.1 hypothetical protein SAMN02583745_01148 [Thorsellia anophelis DSM 18579]